MFPPAALKKRTALKCSRLMACVLHDSTSIKNYVAYDTVFKALNGLLFNVASCLHALRSQRLIQAAFLKNDLLKNLDEGEIRAITACMYPTPINQGCYVIQEGTNGAQAYVLEGKPSSSCNCSH